MSLQVLTGDRAHLVWDSKLSFFFLPRFLPKDLEAGEFEDISWEASARKLAHESEGLLHECPMFTEGFC